jgi:cardiolipin synthase
MSLPNLITMARILCVPLIVWAITSGQMLVAFLLFLAAGISDAVDGYLAKSFKMATELGAILDPVADKALIVSIYVALGFTEALPRWVVILVVSRDILIVGGFLVAMLINRPMPVRPHPVSKLNTVAQIVLAATVLGSLGMHFDAGLAIPSLTALVTLLTLLSIGFYVAEWIRHFSTNTTAR